MFAGLIPVTAESYADPGSKTVILTPFRSIELPATLQTFDGTAANVNTPTGTITVYQAGVVNGTTTLRDSQAAPFVPSETGYAVIVNTGMQPGQYTFVSNALAGTVTVSASSPIVPTTTNQVGVVLPGDVLQFALQPGIPYVVLSVSASQITLQTNYNGTPGSTTAYDQDFVILDRPIVSAALAGTFTTNGTTTVTTSVSQVGTLSAGEQILFVSQPTVIYHVATVSAGSITLSSAFTGGSSTTTAYLPVSYSVQPAQGLMPINDQFGNPKWIQTDPLNLFSSGNITTYNPANVANLYIELPRRLIPAWGEVHVPILPVDQGDFAEGINFMSNSIKGAPPRTDSDKNYVPYISGNGGGITFQTFATNTLIGVTPPPAPYNRAFSYGGLLIGGIQQYTDTRNLGRQGLQLPPFYGIARLFAVYEFTDYVTNGSAYDPTTRLPISGKATNLLRQNVQGPTFWIELDADNDSTFILNANCIDISRSPIIPLASFAAGNYVVESNIFGFDRGFFGTSAPRLVMTAPSPPTTGGNTTRAQAVNATRSANISVPVAGPVTVLPGPLTASDSVVLNYSRVPYMGDAWGSQTNYIDIPYTPGPLLTGNAYQLDSTKLNQNALTRPNQKLLEVLSSVGFVTTLGTGRPVGDFSVPPNYYPSDIGYENPAQYPPTTVLEPRPTTLAGDFINDHASITIGSDILGMSERLPLGALFRDKDFRGESFGTALSGPFVLSADVQGGLPGSLAVSTTREQTEWFVQSVDLAIGQPGDLLVHVDGNQGNYTLLTNYRVNRGGSVFNASGPHPGGEVASIIQQVVSPTGHTNVLVGRAFLVRNTVTDIGSSEVSAGDELMMLIVTTVLRLTNTSQTLAECICGTNGSYEGYSAADLYRISGHPLLVDNVRNDLNPATILLAPAAF